MRPARVDVVRLSSYVSACAHMSKVFVVDVLRGGDVVDSYRTLRPRALP